MAAPLLAVLTHIAAVGNPVYGFWLLFALAWGMGVLLIVAGTAPGLLPKTGMWMMTVKKIFGFVMLWTGLYFVSPFVGDAVYQLGSGVILIFALVFLGCFDQLTSESGAGRRFARALGILGAAAALLLICSGLFALLDVSFRGSAKAQGAFTPAAEADVKSAMGSGRPVVIKFWAKYCVICKSMEKKLNADPRVHDALRGVRALKVDVEQYPGLASRFQVPSVPGIRFIGTDGKERIDLRSAALTVDRFLEKVSRLKGSGTSGSDGQ